MLRKPRLKNMASTRKALHCLLQRNLRDTVRYATALSFKVIIGKTRTMEPTVCVSEGNCKEVQRYKPLESHCLDSRFSLSFPAVEPHGNNSLICALYSPDPWLHFLWFHLPTVTRGLKILKGKFPK